ncbi:MAG: flagellar basal-body rod protein FlgB [Chloroflexota bacterium]|jgi:flagellar basal-body rod protein FlgB|nr:flagellar basal-body rod protein FlgB [Chloroflexota bacterium]
MEPAVTPSDRLIQAALDGLALRQRVISQNVANVDTPGFKASHVEFEQALRTALAGGVDQAAHAADAPRAPTVVMNRGTGQADGNNVDVEGEMLSLAETNITYNALAQLASTRLRQLRTVITDGRQ